ncbi:hypothetical protein [Corynebacterium aquatimens]|uniref:DUF4352 domain-containing protein n=1 Tax=Corynebacterium aquatimens TaxID=1190508 RepID=A0A931E2M3_9CORY|nr:hypothetical protein [Corynebacterium aquatimens]MBG6122096.1 hypothetical protein [Corynebacterium aquatimens]WJY65363.1 hypothetical protein CAQUA_03230 [Corynebacterium aquatimens]
MPTRSRISPAIAAASILAASSFGLVACGEEEGDVDQAGTIIPTTAAAGEDEEKHEWRSDDVPIKTSDKIAGEVVEDPGMDVSYKWQGTSYSQTGGSIVTIAVKNHSDIPMPKDALGEPQLTYNNGIKAERLRGEQSGLQNDGLDMPLGAGATTNLHYAFDVSPGNLSEAQFRIGNVRFNGNLNN